MAKATKELTKEEANKIRTFCVRLPLEDALDLRAYCEEEKKIINGVIADAVKAYLDGEE